MFAASTLAMKGLSLFMVPFVVHSLKAEAFGRLEYLATLAMLLSVVVAFGLEDTLFRFCGQQKSKLKAKYYAAVIYGLTIRISVAFSIVALISILALGDQFENYASRYLAMIITMTLSLECIISVPLGWMRMRGDATLYCVINISRALLQAVLTFVFLSFDRSVEGVFEAGCLAAMMTAVVCFSYQYFSTGLRSRWSIDKKLLTYSYPIVISGLVIFLVNGFDRWLLAESAGLVDLALYAVAAKFALATTIALQPYNMWWSPIRFSLIENEHRDRKLSRFASYGLLQIALFSYFISLFAPIAIVSLFPSDFHRCVLYVAPLIAIVGIKEMAEFLNVGCLSQNRTITQMKITTVSSLVGAGLLLVLVPRLGITGLIVALVFVQFIRTTALYVYSQKIVETTIPMLRFFLLFTLTYVLSWHCNLTLSEYSESQGLIVFLSENVSRWAAYSLVYLCLIVLLFFRCRIVGISRSISKHQEYGPDRPLGNNII